ncbi:hypothetical protein F5148DRAFT_371925 [Russula earlei]|uniref:Uncharacterized protein n=1 Tax=Russula earlei TaxID=71964 RepID=A0ACC0U0H0_9AGAM|nr:hypothetical protein F5148DRAFT_371925 [Russula earlei]
MHLSRVLDPEFHVMTSRAEGTCSWYKKRQASLILFSCAHFRSHTIWYWLPISTSSTPSSCPYADKSHDLNFESNPRHPLGITMRASSISVIFCLVIGVAPSLALAMPGVYKSPRTRKERNASRKYIPPADRSNDPAVLEATRRTANDWELTRSMNRDQPSQSAATQTGGPMEVD